MTTKGMSRRSFVNDMTAAGLGMTVIPSLLHQRRRSPNDGLNVACIGVGGMGRTDVRGMESENIYALCDVDANHLGGAVLQQTIGKATFRGADVEADT